jgi:class 3 adenylate cyclase
MTMQHAWSISGRDDRCRQAGGRRIADLRPSRRAFGSGDRRRHWPSKFAFDIWGETVNVASRLGRRIRGRVHVSAATWRMVEDLYEAEPRGPIHLRGYGHMETYTIARRRSGDNESPHEGLLSVPGRTPATFLERTFRGAI